LAGGLTAGICQTVGFWFRLTIGVQQAYVKTLHVIAFGLPRVKVIVTKI
jgi:hypothetical protein